MVNWPLEFDEASEALHHFREWQLDHDRYQPAEITEMLGQALVSLSEFNGILTYVYGKESNA